MDPDGWTRTGGLGRVDPDGWTRENIRARLLDAVCLFGGERKQARVLATHHCETIQAWAATDPQPERAYAILHIQMYILHEFIFTVFRSRQGKSLGRRGFNFRHSPDAKYLHC
jgi:hypothetical protein